METRYKKRKLCERDKNIQAATRGNGKKPDVKQLEISSNIRLNEQSSLSKGCENESLVSLANPGQGSNDVENAENEENQFRKRSDEAAEVSRRVGAAGDGAHASVKSSDVGDVSKCHNSILGVGLQSNLKIECDDASGHIRLLFTTDYMEDIIDHEFEKEKKFQLSDDYCAKYEIDPERREILIDWLISVQVHFKAGNNSLHLAVNLLDSLLDRMRVPSRMFQVSAVAAFWVAYKAIHGNLSVKALERLCPQCLTKNMILHHEILVLEASRLLETGGDVDIFYNYILFLVFGSTYPPEVYYCGQYLLDVLLVEFGFVDCRAAEKSFIAARTSLDVFTPGLLSRMPDSKRFIAEWKLKMAIDRLMQVLRVKYGTEESLRQCQVYKKYNSSRYYRISSNRTLREYIFAFPVTR